MCGLRAPMKSHRLLGSPTKCLALPSRKIWRIWHKIKSHLGALSKPLNHSCACIHHRSLVTAFGIKWYRTQNCDSLVAINTTKNQVLATRYYELVINFSCVNLLTSKEKRHYLWMKGTIYLNRCNKPNPRFFDHHVWFSSFSILRRAKVNDPLTWLTSENFEMTTPVRNYPVMHCKPLNIEYVMYA